MTRAYLWITVAAVIGTYLLIVIGAIVRVTESGLGCPDWPTCHGQLIPPPDPAALIEYTHRLVGALVSGLILLVTLGAWLVPGMGRGVRVPATLVPLLLAIQIVLGGIVVRLELPAMGVLVHLVFALVILALLIWTAVAASPPPRPAGPPGPGWRRGPLVGLVHATTALLFVLLLVGAYVRATGAGYACVGFPDCNGALLPFGSSRLVDLHLFHRLLAYGVGALAIGVAVQAWRGWRWLPAVPGLALGLLVLLAVQIAIGAVGVSTGLPALVRALHVAGAAAVWTCAVALAAVLTATRAHSPEGATDSAPGAGRVGAPGVVPLPGVGGRRSAP